MSEEIKKQKARERAKRYYQKNKEKVLARQKEYARNKYATDEEFRKKVLERHKKYTENNLEKVREIKRKSQRKYYVKHKDYYKNYNKNQQNYYKSKIEQLEKENKELKQPQVFIDCEDMEERYGRDLYEDYLKEKIGQLKKENNDLRRIYQNTYKKYLENGNEEMAHYFMAQIDACPTFYVEPVIDYYKEYYRLENIRKEAIVKLYCWGEVLDADFQQSMLKILNKGSESNETN